MTNNQLLLCAAVFLFWLSDASAQNSRTETISYHDNRSIWVVGQQASLTCVQSTPAHTSCDGDVIWSKGFDQTYAMPQTFYEFGRLDQVIEYETSATITSGQRGSPVLIKDGNNNSTTMTDWKNGSPGKIRYPATAETPAGALVTYDITDEGYISSVRNEVGNLTCFTYDAMGRISQITYPSDAKVYPEICGTREWNPETFTFTRALAEQHGLAPGHWVMMRRSGNLHVNTYYDGLWRPVLEEKLDYSNISETLTQVVKRYDSDGREVFRSYPKNGVDRVNENTGIHTSYDAIGRTKSVSIDSEHGSLITSTEYLNGFATRTTDPRGKQTYTIYQSFSEPTYDYPTGLDHPEGASTEIHRDPYGKVTALRRRNSDASVQVWRHYVYQADQRLCKSIEPEVGATVFGYDNAGNLTKSASGLFGYGDTASCNHQEAWASGRAVSRTYDSRNRLYQLLFPDGKGDQLWTYTPDGLPSQVTTWNESGGGAVVNAYAYNKRRFLVGESVHLPNWYVWSLGYGYDTNGNLSTQTYPTGLAISYGPNALGQATRASDQTGYSYAHGASYYPNGALKQFTYANGLVHSMSQNARQLPQDVQSSGGVLHDRYAYDGNGNVTSILDVQDGGHLGWALRNRYMSYDGLDRLTDAGSGSFGGDHWHRFTYDALDNLKSWKLAGIKDHTYVYDGQNRLGNLKNPDGSTVVGFGYDPQGNLANKNGRPYTFDYGNRLREAYGPTGAAGGPEWYRYDAYGRRVHAWGSNLNLIASQYSQSGQILYTEDYRANKNQENIYLAGSIIAIRESPHAGGVFAKFQHTDALGSPVAVTNQAGTVIERNDYEPYGTIIGKPNHQGIGYTGHVQDAATGLTYMQQRYYDSQIGLFLSVDPVTAASDPIGMFNRYRYAASNPYRFVDPDGREHGAALRAIDRATKPLPQASCYPNCRLSTSDKWAIGGITALMAAPFILEAGMWALAHPWTATNIATTSAEVVTGTSIGASQGARLFRNLAPADQIMPKLAFSAEAIKSSGYSGRLTYVVTESGELVIGRSAHTSLSGGGAVRAAGEVKFVDGQVRSINNASGHYKPSGPEAREAAEEAFNKAGFNGSGKYKEDKH